MNDLAQLAPISATELVAGVRTSSSVCRARVAAALSANGFFFIDLGRDHDVISPAIERWLEFVEQPLQTKMAYHRSVRHGQASGGWLNLREEPVYMSHMDDMERCVNTPKQQFGCSADTQGTLWPPQDVAPGFRTDVTRCASYLSELSRAVQHTFEAVLGEPKGFMGQAPGYLTLSMYPPKPEQDKRAAAPDLGLHEHSDADVFTLLWQSEAGLEIMTREERFVSVPSLGGSQLLCLPGDWMELWSNGEIPAVRHRVRDHVVTRASMAFFQSVRPMKIGPLDRFVTEERPLRYPVVPSDMPYSGGDSGVPRWRTVGFNPS